MTIPSPRSLLATLGLGLVVLTGAHVLTGSASHATEQVVSRDVVPTLRTPSALWLAAAPVSTAEERPFRGGWTVEAIPGRVLRASARTTTTRDAIPVPRPNPRRAGAQ